MSDNSPGSIDQVREAWREILGHSNFQDDESFFRVGGHSLRAIKLMRILGSVIGTRLPQRMIFEHPTVTDLGTASPMALG